MLALLLKTIFDKQVTDLTAGGKKKNMQIKLLVNQLKKTRTTEV